MEVYRQYFNVFGERSSHELYRLALAKNDQFNRSKTSPNKSYPNWRRSTVIYDDQLIGIKARFEQELKARLPEALQGLNIRLFDIASFEVQLTSHNDGEYYKWHTDNGTPSTASRVLTFVYYFCSVPKRFSGGELVIYAPDGQQLVIEPINDSLVLFSSGMKHEVKPVVCTSGLFEDGRFTLNGWIRRRTMPLSKDWFGYHMFAPQGSATQSRIPDPFRVSRSRTATVEQARSVSISTALNSRSATEHRAVPANNSGDELRKLEKTDDLRHTEIVAKLESLLRLYGELYQLSGRARSIDVLAHITRQSFLQNYYCMNRPIVLRGSFRDSPAVKKWSPEFFGENFPSVRVQITAGRNGDGDYEKNFRQSLQTITMGEFVARLSETPETNDFYLVARNYFFEIPPFRSLKGDLNPPPEIIDTSDESPGSVKLWFGPKGTVTPLHHDEHSILFAQLYGRKHFKLIPSFDLPKLYMENRYYSAVDPENVDSERYKDFLSASVADLVLRPGDALFIPVGWWHWVRSLDISISATFCSFHVKGRNTAWKSS